MAPPDSWNTYWNKHWNWEKVFRKVTSEAYFNLIGDYCHPLEGKKILELGFGTGLTSAKLAEFGADVTLIDNSEEALKLARRNFEILGVEGEFIYGDVFDLDLSSLAGRFDVVFSEGLVEHFSGEERQEIFNIHSRCAKKDALVFIAIPNIYNLPRVTISRFVDKFINRFNRIWIDVPQVDLTSSELEGRVRASGLEPEEITGVLFPISHLTMFYLIGFFPFSPYLILLLNLGSRMVDIKETGIKKNAVKKLKPFCGGRGFFNRTLGYEVVAIGRK